MIRRRKGRARLGKRKKKVFLVQVFFTFIILILFVAAIAWLVRIPQINIDIVEVSGNVITESESLQEIVDDELRGAYALLIPRSNIFFYPKRTIGLRVTELFPIIKEANVSFVDFHTIAIEIKERVPFGLWCGVTESLAEQEDAQCFYLDKEGYIFAKSPNFSGDVFFRYYGPLDATFAITDPLGTQYLPVTQFLGYSLFFEALRDLQVTPVVLVKDTSLDLHLRFEGGAVLLFGANQNLNTVLENLKSILDSDTFSTQGMKDVEYIDLRFGNKVFYKTK